MSDEATKAPVTINREDLYARVWQKPMRALAAQYGISGNGLAKICRRLAVPYPERGYWAKKAAGKSVKQTPLPDKPASVPSAVTITPTPAAPLPPQVSPELEAALAAARSTIGRLTVPNRLTQVHPIVAGWIEERRRWREEARQHPWYSRDRLPPDFTPLERRRHRILNALFNALAKHGYTAKLDERGKTRFEFDGEPAAFSLKEKFRQVRRPLTEEEKQLGFNPKRPWKHETQATGLLQFSIETHLCPGLMQSWLEEPEQPLEQQLSEIAAVLLAAAPILSERRRQREEAEKRRREEEFRRYERQKQAQQDRNRWRHFLGLAQRWRQAETAREFLGALEGKLGDIEETYDDRTANEWIEWARARLAEYDPLAVGAKPILQDIAGVTSWTYHD